MNYVALNQFSVCMWPDDKMTRMNTCLFILVELYYANTKTETLAVHIVKQIVQDECRRCPCQKWRPLKRESQTAELHRIQVINRDDNSWRMRSLLEDKQGLHPDTHTHTHTLVKRIVQSNVSSWRVNLTVWCVLSTMQEVDQVAVCVCVCEVVYYNHSLLYYNGSRIKWMCKKIVFLYEK